MSKKKVVASIGIIILAVLINILICRRPQVYEPKEIEVSLGVECDQAGLVQLFFSKDGNFTEEKSRFLTYKEANQVQNFEFEIPSDAVYLRLDFPDVARAATISEFAFSFMGDKLLLDEDIFYRAEFMNISDMNFENAKFNLVMSDRDAGILFEKDCFSLEESVHSWEAKMDLAMKIVFCVFLDFIFLAVIVLGKKLVVLPIELYRNRSLIFKLAKNDFKTRYAGSYFGIVWAFVQPVVTVVVYWFVFEKGLKASPAQTREGIVVPFVVWLTAGLVPWFFFSEALNSGTNALIEYSYLVKKVVFKISILPIIKIISALFVHLFFVLFTLILCWAYGYAPTLYTLQIIYYSFCLFVLVLAICYATCSMVIFFRDLSQIIGIVLQVGMWATPIMWQLSIVKERHQVFFKLNPMYYIVKGYRDALIDGAWFWQDVNATIYFWIVVVLMFGVGTLIFKRLKVHFADVL